jgi:hypothetical protein
MCWDFASSVGVGLLTVGLALRVTYDTKRRLRHGAAIQLATASLPRFIEALLWWDVLRPNVSMGTAEYCSPMNWGLTSVWLPTATIMHLCATYYFAERPVSPLWMMIIAAIAYTLLYGRNHVCSTLDVHGRLQTLSHPLWLTVVLHITQQRLQHPVALTQWLKDIRTYLPLVLALVLQRHTFKHVLCATSCITSLTRHL